MTAILNCAITNSRDCWDWIVLVLTIVSSIVTIVGLVALCPVIKEWRFKSRSNNKQKDLLKLLIQKKSDSTVIIYSLTGHPKKDFLKIEGKYYWIADEVTLIQIRFYLEDKGYKLNFNKMPPEETYDEAGYLKMF